MGKIGILTRGEESKLVEDQGWDPVGIISVDIPRELDEFFELLSVTQFNTGYQNREQTRHACTSTDVNLIILFPRRLCKPT
jgi:hypothetical protein